MGSGTDKRGLRERFMNIVLTIVLSLFALNALMWMQQPSMIFYPFRPLDATPADWGLDYEDVALATSDGLLINGWYIPAPGSKQVLLFFHGNAGNISHRGESVAIFHRLGLDVFIIDYRGYGASQGKPTEAGLYLDAQAAWDYLKKTRAYRDEDIIVFGRSLGASVAAQLAAQVHPRALIVESAMSSARDFANEVFPLLSRLVLLRYRFDTVASVRHTIVPVLVLHSRADEIMSYSLGEKVFREANEPKSFFELKGGHNSGFLLSQPAYGQALEEFLAGL